MVKAEQDRSITVKFGSSTILLVIALVAGAYLLFRIPHFWLIFLTAIVLATAVDLPVTAMQRRGLSRGFGILLIYIVLVVFIGIAFAALVPIIAGDARALEQELPGYLSRVEQTLGAFSPGSSSNFTLSLTSVEDAIRSNASQLAKSVTDLGLEAGRTAFYVFVTLVVAFFLAVEPGVVQRAAERWVPAAHRDRVQRIVANIHVRIGAWARGQLVIAIIFGALMGLGLKLIGVPYAFSLGVIAGILEVIPYVGGFITVVLAVFSAATVGVPQVVGAVILYIVLVNLESHVLAPLLYGRALGLPPVAILLALLAGVELLGILGALLAVPLTVIGWAIADEFGPKRDMVAAGSTTSAQAKSVQKGESSP